MVETGGGSGGIPSILILAPVIVFGIGIIFLFVAARDERGPKDPAKMFMSRANHPLRHVQVALNAERKQARDKAREAARQNEAEARGDAAPEPELPKPRKQRPNWLRRVS
jgi:uncharacterized membrane protein